MRGCSSFVLLGMTLILAWDAQPLAGEPENQLTYSTQTATQRAIIDRALTNGEICMLNAATFRLNGGERSRSAIAGYLRKACVPQILMQASVAKAPIEQTKKVAEAMVQRAIDVAASRGR